MRKVLSTAAVTLASLVVVISIGRLPVSACLHLPATYEGTISQSDQEGIIFFDNGREDLILKANYQIKGKALPPNFAWVITVPNTPDSYQVADPAVFKETFKWAESVASIPDKSDSLGIKPVAAALLEVGAKIKVGPYEIQPVKARGKEALDALNEWFKANGFAEAPADKLSYFVQNSFTFLAVKVTPQDNDFKDSSNGELPPPAGVVQNRKPVLSAQIFCNAGRHASATVCAFDSRTELFQIRAGPEAAERVHSSLRSERRGPV